MLVAEDSDSLSMFFVEKRLTAKTVAKQLAPITTVMTVCECELRHKR